MTRTELKEHRRLRIECKRLDNQIAVFEKMNKPSDYFEAIHIVLNKRRAQAIQKVLEEENAIISAFDKLPPGEWGVMTAYYIGCMKWDQVARKTEQSVRTVKRLHNQALARL